MFVCCTGMARSGSTWSYNVCRELLEATGEQVVAGFYGEGAELDAFVESRSLEAFPGHVVLKFHQPAERLLAMICDGRARNVFTVRDPRDCVRSRMDFEGRKFDDALMAVAGNLIMHNLYAGASDTLFVRYEEMTEDAAAQVRRIAAHLGLETAEAEVARIVEATGADAARRRVESLGEPGRSDTVEIAGRRVDPETCLQTGHIRDGRPGPLARGAGSGRTGHREHGAARMARRPWLCRGIRPRGRGTAPFRAGPGRRLGRPGRLPFGSLEVP